MNNVFLAGAAAGDIKPTPDIVDNTLHCQMTVRFDAPGSPLQSKVLAATFGGRSMVLVGLDLANLPEPHVACLRQAVAAPLAEWAERMKRAMAAGETFTEIGLAIAARSPLDETVVLSHCNGFTGYLGTDEDRRRGGYETDTWCRMFKPRDDLRPLPYALGGADMMVAGCLSLLDCLLADE